MISAGVMVMGSLSLWSETKSPSPDPTSWWMCNLVPWTGSPRAVGTPAGPAAGDSLADAPPPPVVHRRLGHPSFRPLLPRGGPGGDVSGSAARVHHDEWVESTDRLVPLEGAFNFRDLGGYAGAGGRATRWGRLFRSDTLHELTPGDVDALRAMGLATIIDLRTSRELVQTGRGPVEPASFPLVFHCAAGKDRTGVLAALVLDILGVERGVIVADYVITAERMELLMGRYRADPTFAARLAKVPASRFSVEADTMERFLEALHGRFGGARAWAVSVGVPAGSLDRMEELLLAAVD